MPDEKYVIPENPDYQAENIRKLQDGDPASASQTINPLVQKILESVAYLSKHKLGKVEGAAPARNTPAEPGQHLFFEGREYVCVGQDEQGDYLWCGVPLLDESGKLPDGYIYDQGGLVVQDAPPENTRMGWIDTGSGSVLKYYDAASETWKPVAAVWG